MKFTKNNEGGTITVEPTDKERKKIEKALKTKNPEIIEDHVCKQSFVSECSAFNGDNKIHVAVRGDELSKQASGFAGVINYICELIGISNDDAKIK